MLRGPIMNFTLDGAAPKVVLLAQGVGITPFRSMLRHITLTHAATDASLVHVARADHAFRSETEQWANDASFPVHAQEFRAAAVRAAAIHPNATFYIAGASPFVTATVGLLHKAGITKTQIRQDKYLGYKPKPSPTPGITALNLGGE